MAEEFTKTCQLCDKNQTPIRFFHSAKIIRDPPPKIATKACLNGSKIPSLGRKMKYDIKSGVERTMEIISSINQTKQIQLLLTRVNKDVRYELVALIRTTMIAKPALAALSRKNPSLSAK